MKSKRQRKRDRKREKFRANQRANREVEITPATAEYILSVFDKQEDKHPGWKFKYTVIKNRKFRLHKRTSTIYVWCKDGWKTTIPTKVTKITKQEINQSRFTLRRRSRHSTKKCKVKPLTNEIDKKFPNVQYFIYIDEEPTLHSKEAVLQEHLSLSKLIPINDDRPQEYFQQWLKKREELILT